MSTTTGAIVIGTVIHGTLRFEDLAPAFLNALGPFDPLAAEGFQREIDSLHLIADDADRAEEESALLSSIEDTIGQHLPRHIRFGAVEGDGSDIGFWLVETEEDE